MPFFCSVSDYHRPLPVLSELQRIVSFSWEPGPCLIHTEMVKGSFRLVFTKPSGTLMAWVPLNSNTWSLSCPLSVGSPTVQLAELLGAGRSSTVPELAPKIRRRQKQIYVSTLDSVLCTYALTWKHATLTCYGSCFYKGTDGKAD